MDAPFASFHRFRGTDRYIASSALQDAVNVSVALGRPLLVKGEPGTGKTLLAHHIAEALGQRLIRWHIKSTTRAQDGLYVYDTVRRLHDSRFGDRDVGDIEQYIDLGPLGVAFASSEQVTLLIDEVDKADVEFPNDLLNELDNMSFVVSETGREVKATHRPIVIITSNNEKELPDAFLRRCVFHFIEFPDEVMMRDIVAVHHPGLDDSLLEQCLVKFYWLRARPELRKRPSTSELIDWIGALLQGGMRPEVMHGKLPFLGVLLKKEQDVAVVDGWRERGGAVPETWDALRGLNAMRRR
jgi:MoxR-like ATPase